MSTEPSSPRGSSRRFGGPVPLRERAAGLLDRVRRRPELWAALFVAIAALLLCPWAARRPVRLALGHPAPGDVFAPRDVAVRDDGETALRRLRAEAEVPAVFDRDADAGEEAIAQIARAFDAGRRDGSAALDAGLPLSRAEFDAFSGRRFDPDLVAAVEPLLRDLYRRGILGVDAPAGTGAARVVRDLHLGVEVPWGTAEGPPVRFDRPVREFLSRRLALDHPDWPPALRDALAGFSARVAAPNLNFNPRETARRRREAVERAGEAWIRVPRGGVVIRAGEIVTPSAARLAEAVASQEREEGWRRSAGGTALALLLALLSWPLLRRAVGSRSRTGLAYGVALLSSSIALLATDGLARAALRFGGGEVPFHHLIPAFPHALGPFLAGLVAGVPAAAIASVIGGTMGGLLFGASFRWVVLPLVAGLAAAFAFERPRNRGVVVQAGLFVGAVSAAAVLALRAIEPSPATSAGAEALAAFLCGPVSAMAAFFLVPLLEAIFGVATDLKLLELSNQNLPLLRRLALEAPGTYQHSLVVGNIAESAAEAIGANPLLVRVGAYYHDIGKLGMPGYFVENMRRGENRHDRLAPSMSALVIANHVREGVRMGRRAGLPSVVVDAIEQHHGTKPIRFFYEKALALAGERERVLEGDFRHDGPRPNCREWGILLLADAVEAASRTVVDPTPSRIASLVDRLVDDAVADGQLDECGLTFDDLQKVRESLARSLAALHHARIDYPGFDFNRHLEKRRSHAHGGHDRRPATPGPARRA